MKLILDPSKPLDFGGYIILIGTASAVVEFIIGIAEKNIVLTAIGGVALCAVAASVRRVDA